MRKIWVLPLALCVTVSSFTLFDVKAADPIGELPILERVFEEFTPKGLKLGRFIVLPRIDVGIDYTSNTARTDGNEISERIYTTRGGLTVATTTDDYELTIQGEVDRRDYQKSDDFDRIDANGYIGFVYDIDDMSELLLEASGIKTEQTRYETGTINAAFEPIEIRQYEAGARLRLKPGTVRWDIEAGIEDNNFSDTNFLSDGSRLVQRDRNNTVYSLGVDAAFQRLSSDAAGGITPFLGFQLDRTDFERRDFNTITNDFTGADQSNWRYRANAGLEFSPTGKLRGRVGVGYGIYDPDDGSLDRQASNIIDIDMTYLYSPLTNFVFGAERFFSNNTEDVGGTLETRLSARVIHELTRRWILDASIAYADREFSNDASDQTFITGAGFTHRLNDRFSVLGDVRYISRESNQDNGDYDETRAMIRLNTKF